MEQFNRNSYRKQSLMEEFLHSCLGKLAVLITFLIILLLIAMVTRPSDSMMRWQMEDNIRECLKANDSIQGDVIDDYVDNVGRIFTHADTTKTDKEQWDTYQQHNRMVINHHLGYKTAVVFNNVRPEGIRVGIGIFGSVIPTIKYSDLLMNTGTVRGEYGEQLIHKAPANAEDADFKPLPIEEPYHYNGSPDQ